MCFSSLYHVVRNGPFVSAGGITMGKYYEDDFVVDARGRKKAQRSPKPSPEPRNLTSRPVSRHRAAVADSSDDEAVLARMREADSGNGVTSDDIYRKHRWVITHRLAPNSMGSLGEVTSKII